MRCKCMGFFLYAKEYIIQIIEPRRWSVLVAAPLLNLVKMGQLPRPSIIAWVGVGAMVLGLWLRIWSMQVLGRFYSRTLQISEGQTIVQHGPYRWIRNPGYLGSLLVWVGFGLASGNWLTTLTTALLMSLAYQYRIVAEEAMLLEAFGDLYRGYMGRSWRLLPLIY
jgi:protein-S-isoprenylcysteine O-methyltransferase Ste14